MNVGGDKQRIPEQDARDQQFFRLRLKIVVYQFILSVIGVYLFERRIENLVQCLDRESLNKFFNWAMPILEAHCLLIELLFTKASDTHLEAHLIDVQWCVCYYPLKISC